MAALAHYCVITVLVWPDFIGRASHNYACASHPPACEASVFVTYAGQGINWGQSDTTRRNSRPSDESKAECKSPINKPSSLKFSHDKSIWSRVTPNSGAKAFRPVLATRPPWLRT